MYEFGLPDNGAVDGGMGVCKHVQHTELFTLFTPHCGPLEHLSCLFMEACNHSKLSHQALLLFIIWTNTSFS